MFTHNTIYFANNAPKVYISELVTFKSAKADYFDSDELKPELIAQYLIQGKITLKLNELYKKYEFYLDEKETNIILTTLENEVNRIIKNILDNCVGLMFATA